MDTTPPGQPWSDGIPSDLLAIAPGLIVSLIRNLPAHVLHSTDGAGRWSIHEVLAHMVDLEASERGWLPRIRHILHGLPGPLPRVDAARHLPTYSAMPTTELIDRFQQGRRTNLDLLAHLALGPMSMSRVGQHPELGQITVANMLMAWAMHDLDHLAQIIGIIGHGHAVAVGPISAYLRICRARHTA